MKSNILFPAPSLPKPLTEYITNLIKLINGEQVNLEKCFPNNTDCKIEYMFGPADFLSDINDCLLLVKRDQNETITEMWNKFQSNGYDCTDIFFKIVSLYHEIKHYRKHDKKTIVNKNEMKTKLKKLHDIFKYLKNTDNVEIITKNDHGYEELFTEYDKNRNKYCFRADYILLLYQMSKVVATMENNIKYKSSDSYKLHTDASYTGTIFKDKSTTMIRELFLLFQKEFHKSHTKYITEITKTLFPEKSSLTTKTVSALLNPLNKSRKKLKKF